MFVSKSQLLLVILARIVEIQSQVPSKRFQYCHATSNWPEVAFLERLAFPTECDSVEASILLVSSELHEFKLRQFVREVELDRFASSVFHRNRFWFFGQ